MNTESPYPGLLIQEKEKKKIYETENYICSLFIRGTPSGGYLGGLPGIQERGRERDRQTEREREEANAEERSATAQMYPWIWRSTATRETGHKRQLVQMMAAADTQRDEASAQEGQDAPSRN